MAEIILGLMGGLGLFLYGMRLMSDSLEQAAGARMRAILEFFTKKGIGTAIIDNQTSLYAHEAAQK